MNPYTNPGAPEHTDDELVLLLHEVTKAIQEIEALLASENEEA